MERAKKRAAFITAGALGVAAALTVVLVRAGDGGPGRPDAGQAKTRKVPVSYAVDGTGTARITFTRGAGTRATTITAHLPWRQSTDVAAGKAPAAVSIVLGRDGGRATCSVTVHGKAVQHATAYGAFGRATCAAPLTAS